MPRRYVLAFFVAGVSLVGAGPLRAVDHRDDPGWRFPGEYESHQAMWMLWPTFENKAGFPSMEPLSEMIRALSGHTHVNLAVQDADDEAAARSLLVAGGVPLGHVHFFHLEHGDLWARDMGPQFTRSRDGRLRVNDWNFNMWGNEEPDSESSTFEEDFDRRAAAAIQVPVLDARAGRETGVRMIHEGGSVSHNGKRHHDRGGVGGDPAEPRTGPLLRRRGSRERLRPAEHLRSEPGLAGLPGDGREGIPADAGREEGHLGTHRGRGGPGHFPRRARAPHPGAQLRRRRHPARGRLHALHHQRAPRRVRAVRIARQGGAGAGARAGDAGADAGREAHPLAPGAEPRASRAHLRHPLAGDHGVRRHRSGSSASPRRSSPSTSSGRETGSTTTTPSTTAGKTAPPWARSCWASGPRATSTTCPPTT